MISDFVPEDGCLQVNDRVEDSSNEPTLAIVMFEPGAGKDGYFKNGHLLTQVETAILVFESKYSIYLNKLRRLS